MTTWCVLVYAALLGGSTQPSPAHAPRPTWIDRGAVVDEGVWEWPVRSGWWATPEEALRQASAQADKAVVRSLPDADVGPRYVHAALQQLTSNGALVADSYTEHADRPYGQMVQVHLLVELAAPQRVWLMHEAGRLAQVEARRWVWRAGLMLLVVLAVAAGYWHLDQKTQGYATGRLRVLASAVLIVGAAAIWQYV